MTASPDTQTDSSVSWSEFLRSGNSAALLLVCLAVWLHAADSLIVATKLPAIVGDIGGAAYVSWTVSIYEIGSIVAGAASALLTMRHGLRLPMAGAALLFSLGCAASAAAPDMRILLIGRALQGVGGGGLVAMAFVAIGTLFERRYTARVMAMVSAFWGLSAFLGPLLGGLFVEYATWRIGFWFFAAQALGLAAFIFWRAPSEAPARVDKPGRFPLGRLALLCGAVILISSSGVRVEPLHTGALALAGLACLALFLRRDARAGGDRLLPHAPFDPRTPAGSTLLMLFALSMATIPILAYGPLLMTAIHGVSALTAGYVVAASSIGWTVAAIAVSGSPERLDRMWIALGMALATLSIAGFAYAVPAGPVWLIAVIAFAEGAGFGLAYTFILRRVVTLVPAEEEQRVTGAMPTVQRLGYALGAALMGIAANAAGFAGLQGAEEAIPIARILFLVSLPIGCIGLAAMWGLVRGQGARD
ncbi:MFS transporter [Marimonas sp. MJW-29]|uniref:MFS transporter n=1 Tax=Sulfitobacter sediminis TaxID=3234186 RepID=A0ABV3RLJ3_9RHOB